MQLFQNPSLYFSAAILAWGSFYVSAKYVLEQIPPATVLFLRYLIAAIFLLVLLSSRQMQPIARRDYKYVFCIGFVGYFLTAVFQFYAIQHASASQAALFQALSPLFLLFFITLSRKEKWTWKKALCFSVALIGILLLLQDSWNNILVLSGLFCALLAAILWSFMTLAANRLSQKYDDLQITTYGIVIALLCTLPHSTIELATQPGIPLFQWPIFFNLLYMGIVCTGLAYVLWFKGLALAETNQLTRLYALQPVCTILLATFFLHENLTPLFCCGALLILGAVLASSCPKVKKNPQETIQSNLS